MEELQANDAQANDAQANKAQANKAQANELLSDAELCFFKHYGYLIKRRAASLAQCQKVVERMWQSAPPSIKRNAPATWQPISADVASADPLLVWQDTRWQFRAASTEADLLDLVFSKQIVQWAEQLLGEGTLRQPTLNGKPMGSWGAAWPGGPVDPQMGEGVRGIYATLPVAEGSQRQPDRLHTDGHPFHLGLVCLLEDNPPDSGAFKIWPASHQRFYPLFPMQYDQARVPYYPHLPAHKGILHPPAYLAEVQAVEADTQAVDCYGEAGDIVFWHHRLGHMAGHNYGLPRTIRQAVLYDFCKTDLDTTRMDPPQDNMWRDWSAAVQAADVEIPRQLAAEQRLPITMLEA
jgi:hypothetical protein